MSRPRAATRADYAAGNALAARIILADPGRYDGLPVIWARLYLSTATYPHVEAPHGALGSKREPATVQPARARIEPPRPAQGGLFDMEAR